MFELMPFGNSSLEDYFDDLEKDFWGRRTTNVREFRTNILDKGDKYILQAELPGFKKEDINININGDLLTISANHTEKNEENKDEYVRKEIRCGSYTRSFDISNVDVDNINAEYNNGILQLNLPKITEKETKTKNIEIK